jgi:hypothetical protein
VFLAVFFFPFQAHSQVVGAVTAPILEGLISQLKIDQAAYYWQQGQNFITEMEHLAAQGKAMADTLSRSVLNIKLLKDIEEWDDFFDWYNRQLYLENQTQEMFEGLNVFVGNKTYSLLDIESWGRDVDDFWNNEFTPEQRREMWQNLGLTPSNYAYVQAWKEKELGLARKFLANPGTQNNRYVSQMIRNNEFLKQLAGNSDLPIEKQLGEPEIAAISAEVEIDSNRTLHEISSTLADLAEYEAMQRYKERAPNNQPALSDWDVDVFGSLTD